MKTQLHEAQFEKLYCKYLAITDKKIISKISKKCDISSYNSEVLGIACSSMKLYTIVLFTNVSINNYYDYANCIEI